MHSEEFTELSSYVVAHADDWQIFMNPNAYNDLISPHKKVIFIITTAGDAGNDEKFWLAREEGTKSSIRYCLAPLETISESTGTKTFNDHIINYWSANHVTCYFLRLPDGNLDGQGFALYNNQSLSRFRTEQIRIITAVDGSSRYDSWQDFHTTLQTIIQLESHLKSCVWINYLNPDTFKNISDHMDHIATGQAIQDMTIISTINQALFIGYNIVNTGKKLPSKDLFRKAGMFAAYEKAVYDISGYSTLKEDPSIYFEWCIRSPEFIVMNAGGFD